ncbi:class I SAM-dependent methyltransferase [Fictibacillus terranigra]|uniref:Class I SAM-dependent methyltransferase n=1 Tax=Fictibacillus terranigra TaxID=3058424 RepID=A0ABT8E2X7_9BACL|nr:class I SAM-dependent methyltransferase [Fictibacillus sp. CENA-BCM004]MDN4072252.1 class I SAM-dependent methyltransferase [Fictibacillus sp. CENA-BCM004]
MTMDFHAAHNKRSYASRTAAAGWKQLIEQHITLKDRLAVDIGCGGGIYTKAMIEMGARHVTAVDFSEKMLEAAGENCSSHSAIVRYVRADAANTGLPSYSADMLLERAVIHHLNGLKGCTSEAFRLLKPGGTFIVQDRTPEDSLLPGTDTHIRGYFFEKAPELIEKEIKRRFSSERVIETLENAGFSHVEEVKLWEMRKHYSSVGELSVDLRKRTGRSILFEMNNEKLEQLISYIETRLRADQEISERDRWTLWFAKKENG